MNDGEVKHLATTGLASARDHVTHDEVRELLAEAKSTVDVPPVIDPDTGKPFTIQLRRRADAPPIGDEAEALTAFRLAARNLKTAETAYREAQQVYGEAVKRLSEEAVK